MFTQGDFDDIADELEALIKNEKKTPSTAGHTSHKPRRYRPPKGPKRPSPYEDIPVEKLKSPGNFWYNRKFHRNADVPPMDTENPLGGLIYCMPEMAKFINSTLGLLHNLNLVAERIYNLAANRSCADTFCQYG